HADARGRPHAQGLYRRRAGRLGQRARRADRRAGDRALRDVRLGRGRRRLGLRRALHRRADGTDLAAARPVRRAGGAARLMAERLATLVGIYALLGLGYQLVFGQLGALNLAQGALFGVGAYAAALTAPALGPLAVPVAIVAAALPAALVAIPVLRLQSHYFALATLALASLVNLLAVHAEGLTGGANGLIGFGPALPRGTALLVPVWLCLIAVVLAQAHFFAGRRG